MIILKVYKHGIFQYKNREVRTPCSINIERSSEDLLNSIDDNLHARGFKNSDYEFIYDSGSLLGNLHETPGYEIYNGDDGVIDFPDFKPSKKKEPKNKKETVIQHNISTKDLEDKILKLSSEVSDLSSLKNILYQILDKIEGTPIEKKTKTKKLDFEDESDVNMFIPKVDINKLIGKTNVDSSKSRKTRKSISDSADILSSLETK